MVFKDDTFPVHCLYIYLTFGVIFNFLPAISGTSDWIAFFNTYSSTKYLDVEATNTGSCLLHTTKYKYLSNHSIQSRSTALSYMCVASASWKCSASVSRGNTPKPLGDCRSDSWTNRRTSSIYRSITVALMSLPHPPTPIFYWESVKNILQSLCTQVTSSYIIY